MGDGGRVVGFVTFISFVEVMNCPCCVIENTDVGTFPRNAADLPRIEMSPLRNGVHRDSGRASWAMYWAFCITVYTHICGIAINSRSVNMPARVYM
jgi:hypothetical protein